MFSVRKPSKQSIEERTKAFDTIKTLATSPAELQMIQNKAYLQELSRDTDYKTLHEQRKLQQRLKEQLTPAQMVYVTATMKWNTFYNNSARIAINAILYSQNQLLNVKANIAQNKEDMAKQNRETVNQFKNSQSNVLDLYGISKEEQGTSVLDGMDSKQKNMEHTLEEDNKDTDMDNFNMNDTSQSQSLSKSLGF